MPGIWLFTRPLMAKLTPPPCSMRPSTLINTVICRCWIGQHFPCPLLNTRRDSDLQPNHYGIPEPSSGLQGITPAQLDIIFVPLLAFDSLGTRLGMGKGYYDRALAEFRSGKTANEKPLLIGLAHECQRVERLERAIWDVPLDRIITDQTVYLVHS